MNPTSQTPITDTIAAQRHPATPREHLRAALAEVVALGPGFLAGTVHADDMAHCMVRAVREHADALVPGGAASGAATSGAAISGAATHVPGAAGPGHAASEDVSSHDLPELMAAAGEVYTCGSGYLAGRCDSDCVMRTMADIVAEFGDLATAG